MKLKTVSLLIFLYLIPGLSFSSELPHKFFIGLESGLNFPTFSSLNTGINNTAQDLKSTYGTDVFNSEFKNLNFSVPILFRIGMYPFTGKPWQDAAVFLKTGYILTYSYNTVRFTDTMQKYNFLLGILPVEIGIDYRFARFSFLGSEVLLSGSVAGGFYFGFLTRDYSEEPDLGSFSGENYPQKFSGTGLGIILSFNALWKISRDFGITSNIYYRHANISSLKDGSDQLFINDTGFIRSSSTPTGGAPAEVNLSGMGFSFGIEFSFGKDYSYLSKEEKRLRSLRKRIVQSTGMGNRLRISKNSVVLNLGNILFKTGATVIKLKAIKKLIPIAEFLKQQKNLKIVIEGHTDNLGNKQNNFILSRKRALAVYQFFVKQADIKAHRIKYRGLGSTKPIANNTSKEGRQKNRRVEIIFK